MYIRPVSSYRSIQILFENLAIGPKSSFAHDHRADGFSRNNQIVKEFTRVNKETTLTPIFLWRKSGAIKEQVQEVKNCGMIASQLNVEFGIIRIFKEAKRESLKSDRQNISL